MPANLNVEKSKGVNLDFNFKTPLTDRLFLSVNQAFFITNITNPVISNIDSLQNQVVAYENADGNLSSKGFDTNIRLSMGELHLYMDYTYLDARKTYDYDKQLELAPQHKVTTTITYEDEEEGWRVGLETFYVGNQFLENGYKTPSYWLMGVSLQKKFLKHFTVAINVENLLDVRQTRFENIVGGSINNPVFHELYAPLDGIVGNMVLKFDLY